MNNIMKSIFKSTLIALGISSAVMSLFHLALFSPIKHIETAQLRQYYLEYNELIYPFCKDYNINNKGLEYISTMSFKDKRVLGTCFTMGKGYILNISREHIKISSEIDVRSTVYHELTHCLLREPHSNNRGSYMYFSSDVSLTKEMLEEQVREVAYRVCILKI